jgi:hypothetical protein
MTAPLVLARLDDLVFARLATSPRPLAHAAVTAALRPDAPSTYDEARWSTAVFESIARLQTAGVVDSKRVAAGGASAATMRLGAAGALTWKRLHERVVPGLALGIAAADTRALDRLAGRDAWVAAIVGRALAGWSGGPPPTLGAVCDAVVWRGLGLPGKPRRTPAEIRAHFVGALLGGGTGTAERRAALLAARETGAVRADVRALRDALVRRWLCGQQWAVEVPAAADPFAAAVHAAAARATVGVVSARKVFIASVWRDPAFAGQSLDAFKRQLLISHTAGSVRLARADLVAAMDPELVLSSEVQHLEATYHFIERGPT